MKELARRAFLRIAGGAAAAPAALQLHTKLAAHGVSGLAGAGGVTGAAIPSSTMTPHSFTDFGAWWKKFGEAAARREARHVQAFDPDILDMRLPLASKVRMQRQRNFERVAQERREWFAERFTLKGVVEWWP